MPWKLCLLPLFAPQWSVVKPVLKLWCFVWFSSSICAQLFVDEMLFFHCVCLCVCARLNGMGKIQLGFNDYLRRRRIYQSLPEYLDSWHQAFFLVNYDKTKLDSNILICCSQESSGKTKNIKDWIPLSFDYFRALALTSGLLLLGCKWAIIDVNMWAAQA